MTTPQSKQIVAGDHLLTYYQSIPAIPSKKTLVFLHGWRSQSTLWFEGVQEITQAYTCYFIDAPGFGKSPASSTQLTLGDYAQIMATCIQKLAIKHIVLVGHSFGGRIAVKLSTNHPNWLEGMVLVNSAGVYKDTVEKKVKKTVAKVVKPLFQSAKMQPLRAKIYQSMGAEDYVATPNLQQTYLNIVTEDLTPVFPSVTVPVHLIWGDKDEETPISIARTMQKSMQHADLEILKGAGHFSFLDKPQEFEHSVMGFVQTLK